jgi:hypothetical protein
MIVRATPKTTAIERQTRDTRRCHAAVQQRRISVQARAGARPPSIQRTRTRHRYIIYVRGGEASAGIRDRAF